MPGALPRDAVRQVAVELRSSALVELTRQGEVRRLPPLEAGLRLLRTLVAFVSLLGFLIGLLWESR